MTLSSYHDLIARKRVAFEPHGFTDVSDRDLLDGLFDHQKHGVEFGLRCGCAAEFYDTGLGKTAIALAWGQGVIRRTNKPVLMLAPLAVGAQHVKEAERLGIETKISRFGIPPESPCIAITNYERLERFDPNDYAAVILDECFAKGTKVDTPHGKKHIEELRVGDHILNCSGIDQVSDVHRREVQYAVLVKVAGTSFTTSPNHPLFTQRGWVGAQHLRPGDHALATREAMHLVRGDIRASISSAVCSTILRDILLSEVADVSAEHFEMRAFGGGSGQTRAEARSMASVGSSEGQSRDRTDYCTQSNIRPGSARENLLQIESHEPQTFRAWGKWERNDGSSDVNDGCAWTRLDCGISFVTGSTKSRLSNLLQDRLRQSETEARNRGGWQLASCQENSGPKAGCDGPFVRVDGIEILERGDSRLEQLREADGKLYFYDLGATRHPSYSVEGCLVHNSSILKSFTGKTTRKLIEAFAATPYRLACTATPAPNDHSEIGTHSSFLGVMSRDEMLSRWFIHDSADTGQWRIKGHAAGDFWRWVASWARCVGKPSDLGYSDEGFVLPPLNLHRHTVEADRSIDPGEEKKTGQGLLFRIPNTSATSIHKEKRLTKDMRAAKIAELVLAEPDEPWLIWCETDYDAEALQAVLPGVVNVHGKLSIDIKEERLHSFTTGETKWLLTKPSIAGFGLNWQHCARMAFMGLSFSYESFYQAVRRCWRFRQLRPVEVHVSCADTEASIWEVVSRKADDHGAMKAEMATAMREASAAQARKAIYTGKQEPRLPAWMMQ